MQWRTVMSVTSAAFLVIACREGASSQDHDAATVDGAVVDATGAIDGGADLDAPPASTDPCAPVFTTGVDGDAVHAPILGIDAVGDAVALWKQGEYGPNNALGAVYGGRFDDTAGWGAATTFAGGFGNQSKSLAVAPSGDAFAVWQGDVHGEDPTVWTARAVAGAGWTAPAALPTEATFVPFAAPDVATDASGDAIVVWSGEDGPRALRYRHDTGWGEDVLLDPGSLFRAMVAMGPGGVAMAIWSRDVDGQRQVRASKYTPVDGWATPVTLADDLSPDELAFDAAGNAVAALTRYTEAGSEVWVAHHDATLGWGEPLRLDAADTLSHEVRLALAASGHAVVAWTEHVPSEGGATMPRVALASYAPATGWSDAMIQSTTTSAFGADVGIDAAGNALAAWHEFEDPDTRVYARRFSPVAGWGERFLLLEAPARDPVLAMNASGDVVVVWVSWVGNGSVLSGCAMD
jgi:hypothetical protein